MSFDWLNCIVRILGPDGQTAGTGFFVSVDGLVATCSHVVLGCRAQKQGQALPESVQIVLIGLDTTIQTKVIDNYWRGCESEDVAILRIDDPRWETYPALPLGPHIDSSTRFNSFGYADPNPNDGLLTNGEILGLITLHGIEALQLRSPEVTPGFSGAPIWDPKNKYVVGMVSDIANVDRYGRQGTTAFAIPSGTISDICPQITLQTPRITSQPSPSDLILDTKPEGRCDWLVDVSLPAQYVPRLELLNEVKELLLGTSNDIAFTSGLQAKALHGMGGIGKSVMARAICDDPQVRERFPNGILWATLGENPDISKLLKEWVNALGGRMQIPAPSPNQWKTALTQLLQERQCLLVADDVWRDEDLEFFQVGGDKCQLLITTRDRGIAERSKIEHHSIPPMSQSEAIQLLQEWADGTLDHAPEGEKVEVVERLMRLPLAIKLAGGQLRNNTPKQWLEEFQELRDLDQEWESDDPEKSLYASFSLSIKSLKESARQLYVALGVFPEDEIIPDNAIIIIWQELQPNLSNSRSLQLLCELGSKALLERLSEGSKFHDLLRQLIIDEMGDTATLLHKALLQGYAKTKTEDGWHTTPDDGYIYNHLVYHLVAVEDDEQLWGLFCKDAWFHKRFESSQYLWDTFISDLMQAWNHTLKKALKQIKLGKISTGLHHCVHYSLIRTTLNSVAINFEPALVDRALKTNLWHPERVLSVASHIRKPEKYVELLETISNSLENCKLSTTTLQSYLELTLNIEEDTLRLDALVALAQTSRKPNRSRKDVLKKAAEAALSMPMKNESGLNSTFEDLNRAQYESLIKLIPMLEDETKERALNHALEAALSLPQEDGFGVPVTQLEALTKLIPLLEGGAKEKILEYALEVALSLPQEDEFGVPVIQLETLTKLIPLLEGRAKEQILEYALEVALSLPQEDGFGVPVMQLEALTKLIPLLEGEVKEQILEYALEAALSLPQEDALVSTKFIVLTDLIPLLKKEAKERTRKHAIKLAKDIITQNGNSTTNRYPPIQTLIKLAPLLEGKTKEEFVKLLATTLELPDAIGETDHYIKIQRTEYLIELLPFLSNNSKELILQQALDCAHKLPTVDRNGDSPRVNNLISLIPYLQGKDKEKALHQTLETIYRIPDNVENIIWGGGGSHRSDRLRDIASHIDGNLLKSALENSIKLGDQEDQIVVISNIVTEFDDQHKSRLLNQALKIVEEISDPYYYAKSLVNIIPKLKGKLKYQLLQKFAEISMRIESDFLLYPVLSPIISHFNKQQLQQLFDQTLNRINSLKNGYRIGIFSGEMPLRSSQPIITLLCELAEELDRTAQRKVLKIFLNKQLKMIPQAREKDLTADSLVPLIPLFKGFDVNRVLKVAINLRDLEDFEGKYPKAEILISLAPKLNHRGVKKALKSANSLPTKNSYGYSVRAKVLIALAPMVRENDREKIIQDALNISLGLPELTPDLLRSPRIDAILDIVPFLNEKDRIENLYHAVDIAKTLPEKPQQNFPWDYGRSPKLDALIKLAPELDGDAKPHITKTSLQIALQLPVYGVYKSESPRANALNVLAPAIGQHEPHISILRKAIADLLWEMQNAQRKDVLELLSYENLFNPETLNLPPESFAEIAESVIDICNNWRWV